MKKLKEGINTCNNTKNRIRKTAKILSYIFLVILIVGAILFIEKLLNSIGFIILLIITFLCNKFGSK